MQGSQSQLQAPKRDGLVYNFSSVQEHCEVKITMWDSHMKTTASRHGAGEGQKLIDIKGGWVVSIAEEEAEVAGTLGIFRSKGRRVACGEVDYPKSTVFEAIWYFVCIFKVGIFMCWTQKRMHVLSNKCLNSCRIYLLRLIFRGKRKLTFPNARSFLEESMLT